MSLERRQFPRLELSEDAYAVDAQGRELGKVRIVSGGGMQITGPGPDFAAGYRTGQPLRVTIMEPGSQTAHTIDVVVRHTRGADLGVEFVTGVTPA
jgi:hypothetical protein